MTQIKATLGDVTLAEVNKDDLEKVEGNWYFKSSALLDRSKFIESQTHSHCPWKGDASYYNFKKDNGEVVKDVAWYYPAPIKGAEMVTDRVAFYVGRVPGLKVA